MSDIISDTLQKGKESLDSALRKKAFDDLAESLTEKGIDINDIEEADLEVLVASQVADMNSSLKGFASGGVFMLILGSLF
jgi:hypothetical protein